MSAEARNEGSGPDGATSVAVRRWTHSDRSVPRARHEFRQKSEAWGLAPSVADNAELVVSELVTNAVRHARSPRGRLIETRFERVPGGVRIEVHDANSTYPVRSR
jgi:serine/threonine-protein kinase RsbW